MLSKLIDRNVSILLCWRNASKCIFNKGGDMNAVQMNTRLPEELKLFLLEQAKKEGRSLNNYLVRHFEELRIKLTQESAKA